MAGAFLKVVCDNLNSLIQKELGLLWGVGKEMEKISSTLSTIRAVLEDAEQKQLKDKSVQIWLQKLKDTAYDIDDIVDEFATEASRLQSHAQNSRCINKVHTSFLTCNHKGNVLFRHRIGKRMKEIGERLDAIAQERIKFHLREGVVDRRVETVESRETGSILTQSHVYGRGEDGEKIVELLVKNVSNCDDISIYPIIGMGGLGKTTLAQLVFNDERVNMHFETKIWVCVSEDFDVKRLIKAIIRSACGVAGEDSELEPLQRRLQEMLNGKRYLLVLDDVWNEDQEKWDRLKYVLACGSKGAAIIVTTRIEKTASIMGTLPPHRLLGLSEDDCWSLFRQRAFANEVEEDHPNLVAIGKDIVRKCGGVPLAAKTLGGLMRFKRGESEWLFVRESDIWNLPQDENSILPALRLSYYNLPLELRQCFSYCAIFPKDSKIEKENIIHLWMANGFISSKGNLELEDIGNEIWNELHWRSFFQDVEKDYWGNISSFMMHDLVHDLAQSMLVDECQIMEAGKSTNISKRIHHVRLVIDSGQLVTNSERLVSIPEPLSKVESLRTLLLQPMGLYRVRFSLFEWLSMPMFFSKYLKFGFLRVLVASGAKITNVSSSIGKLKHLRYLDLSWTNVRLLPESICSLWNLQTLRIEYCEYLQGLPKGMRRMRNLRHLYMEGCSLITQMPPKIGQLTCLQTLSFFIVGKSRGFHLRELQSMNLRGKLQIKHLERVKDLKDAREANLIGKKDLRHLILSWKSNGESELQHNAKQIFGGLVPHPNLELLVIRGYMGTQFPLWMRNPVFKNVKYISLSDCKNCLELPPFGRLSSLRTLRIEGMNSVEYIDNESHGGVVRGFASLKEIHIFDLPSLKKLSIEEGSDLFPLLTSLIIEKCPNLTLPCLASPKGLTVWRCSEVLLGSISNLHSLTSLSVAHDDEVISFPNGMLRNLAALQRLDIRSFTKLEVLPTDLSSLIALESFCIRDCHELKCLPEEGLRGLTSLQSLMIDSCNKLKSLSEGLQFLTALEHLNVWGCHELECLPEEGLRGLTSLQSLMIDSCNKLKSLSEGLQFLTALEHLNVRGCHELECLPEEGLRGLTSLQSLVIDSCNKFKSFSEGLQFLTALRSLTVEGCPELVSLPEGSKHLNSLQHLFIAGKDFSRNEMICSKLVVLPEVLQHVTALQSLSISSYPELASLPDWLENLTCLQYLGIGNCPKLASLPATIQSLTQLHTLSIWGCPELVRRCEKERGEDWGKTSHIPRVYLSPRIQIEGQTANGCMQLKRMSSSCFFSFCSSTEE